MADLSRSSTLVEDPLHAYSGLSLFPRTLKSLSNFLPPRLHQSDDLHQTHTLLQSMPFEIQKEHQEQAKAILDDSSELLKEGIGTTVASKDMDVGGKMNPIPNKRERRPGLDRKRGHFSFKPTTSQQPQNEPTFDASKYPNPEEYFAAYERYKIAKQEWQKQTGTIVTDAHQNQPSRRPRRPGLPGRKRGSYKHTYTDSNLTDATNLEASESKIPIPSEQSLERTTTAEVTTADRDVADSAVDTDKDFQNILTELLACAPDELEGDNGVKLVEERLQFKAIDVGMLSFPEFQDVKKTDLKVSGRNPSKRRTVLSDIQNMLKGIHSDGARKNSKSPSPNPPGDQFSFPDTDHLLPGDQQSSEVDLAKDLNICSGSLLTNDLNKVNTNASPSNVGTVYVDSPFNSSVQKTSNGDNSDLNTCSGSPVTNNTDKVITNASPSIVETVKVASPFKSSVQKTSNDDDSDTHSGIRRFNSNPDGNADDCVDDLITNRNSAALEVNVDTQTKGNEGDLPINESQVNKYTDRREKDVGINEETDQLQRLAEYASREAVRMDPSTIEEDSIPCQQDASLTSINRAPEQYNTVDGAFERVEHSEGQHGEGNDNTDTACGVEVENAQEEVHNSSHKESNKRRKRRSLYSNTKKRSKTVHGESEGEMQMKTLSHESGAKKQTKRKSNEREEKKQMKTVTREGKAFSRRKSLAGAGTKWESGFRRSTRIKSRPLEYWRGERFLFGRIHQSLATVIGIKYESPGKGQSDKPKLKVKSFVSDDYKELIDLAALH